MKIIIPDNKTEYFIQKLIGEGLTSCVYKAIRKHKDLDVEQTVALKILKSTEKVQSLKNEIQILVKVQSEHCVRLLGWEELSEGTGLVLEYLNGLSLDKLVSSQTLNRNCIIEITSQVQRGLKDLHDQEIIHGDIHPKNIFITKDGVVKLLDFGFGSLKSSKQEYGHPQFVAPEVWTGKNRTHASDLFALGLVYKDMLDKTLLTSKPENFWRNRSLEIDSINSLLKRNPLERSYLDIESRPDSKTQISEIVRYHMERVAIDSSTRRLNNPVRETPSCRPWGPVTLLIVLLTTITLSAQDLTTETPSIGEVMYSLDVRSQEWSAITVHKIHKVGSYLMEKRCYTPCRYKLLPKGDYEIFWQRRNKRGKIFVHLNKNSRILIP